MREGCAVGSQWIPCLWFCLLQHLFLNLWPTERTLPITPECTQVFGISRNWDPLWRLRWARGEPQKVSYGCMAFVLVIVCLCAWPHQRCQSRLGPAPSVSKFCYTMIITPWSSGLLTNCVLTSFLRFFPVKQLRWLCHSSLLVCPWKWRACLTSELFYLLL